MADGTKRWSEIKIKALPVCHSSPISIFPSKQTFPTLWGHIIGKNVAAAQILSPTFQSQPMRRLTQLCLGPNSKIPGERI